MKIIISAFACTTGVKPVIACVKSNKIFCIPIVIPACFTLLILLITVCLAMIVFYFCEFIFFLCGCFFRWYVLPVSFSSMGFYTTTSLSNSASCPYTCPLFFLPFFLCIPLLSFILPFCCECLIFQQLSVVWNQEVVD